MRRTNPILVRTCAWHNLKKSLTFRRIPAVFQDLMLVKRTQFSWKRSQSRRRFGGERSGRLDHVGKVGDVVGGTKIGRTNSALLNDVISAAVS